MENKQAKSASGLLSNVLPLKSPIRPPGVYLSLEAISEYSYASTRSPWSPGALVYGTICANDCCVTGWKPTSFLHCHACETWIYSVILLKFFSSNIFYIYHFQMINKITSSIHLIVYSFLVIFGIFYVCYTYILVIYIDNNI